MAEWSMALHLCALDKSSLIRTRQYPVNPSSQAGQVGPKIR